MKNKKQKSALKNPARKSASKKNKKAKSSKSSLSFLTDFRDRLASDRFKKTFGLVLLTSAVLLSLAFVSHLFTWKHDQSFLMGDLSEMLMNRDIQLQNWLGKLGALVAHVCFYRGFGVSSFVIPFLMAFWAGRILLKSQILPTFKTLNTSIFSLVWCSVFFGFFFADQVLLGGMVGFQSKLWLTSILGNVGGVAVILVALCAFVLLTFNPSFAWIGAVAGKMGSYLESEETEEGEIEQAIDAENFENPLPEVPDMVSETVPLTLSEKQVKQEEDILASILSDEDEELPTEHQIELENTSIAEEEKNTEVNLESSDDGDFEVAVAAKEEVLTEDQLEDKVKEFGEYDPTLDLSSYVGPGIDLLIEYSGNELSVSQEELEANKNRIVETLANYKIGIKKIKATIGPTVTLYEIIPEAGVRISKIKNLEDDIALSLAALGIRIIAPIPGKGTIGIEVPNSKPDIVAMRTLIASDKFQNSDMALPVALGKTIANETLVADLAKMPHLLMAGATGQGKSVGLNAILVSLLYKKHPSQIKFVLVDPKKVELTLFNKIERHYLAKLPGDDSEAIITDTKKVVTTLNSLCVEMDQRYELLKEAMVRNIKEYNQKFIQRKLNPEKGHRYMPYIVLVVDEFADLIMTAGKEVEGPIARLAQLARAIGIHLIIATQRPSVNIITGTIKANFPARIAFRVTSKIDSRTILDAGGADQLIGRGDMLYNTGNSLIRLQCGFVDTPEVDAICEFIGSQRGYPEAFLLPEYVDESASEVASFDADDRDAKFEEAARLVVMHQQGSTSLIQRKLKLGYNRAGRIVDQMEAAGILGPFEGSKARKVLIPDEYSLEQFLNKESQIDTE